MNLRPIMLKAVFLFGVAALFTLFAEKNIAEGHMTDDTSAPTTALAQQEPAGDCPGYRARHYEIHYGFVNELLHSGNEEPVVVEVSLTPSYIGGRCSGTFCSALHLTSELLWEKDDPDSTLSSEYCKSPGGSYHTSLGWKSRTGTGGDAWDGLSFVFGYPSDDLDNAALRIDIKVTAANSGAELFRSSDTYTARELEKRFPQVFRSKNTQLPYRLRLTTQGHELEFGAHFSLTYRVYDFLLMWGYGTFKHYEEQHVQTCENPAWPVNAGPLKNWQGRLRLSNGMIHPVQGRYFKPGEDSVTDCHGTPLSAGQLVPELCFESFVEEKVARQYFRFEDSHVIENGNVKALSLNLVAPTNGFTSGGDKPVFSVHVSAEGHTLIDGSLPVEQNRDEHTEESTGGNYELPWKWKSIDAVFRCADTLHFVHGHEHW